MLAVNTKLFLDLQFRKQCVKKDQCEVRECGVSSSVLLSRDCFGSSGSFVFPDRFGKEAHLSPYQPLGSKPGVGSGETGLGASQISACIPRLERWQAY